MQRLQYFSNIIYQFKYCFLSQIAINNNILKIKKNLDWIERLDSTVEPAPADPTLAKQVSKFRKASLLCLLIIFLF